MDRGGGTMREGLRALGRFQPELDGLHLADHHLGRPLRGHHRLDLLWRLRRSRAWLLGINRRMHHSSPRGHRPTAHSPHTARRGRRRWHGELADSYDLPGRAQVHRAGVLRLTTGRLRSGGAAAAQGQAGCVFMQVECLLRLLSSISAVHWRLRSRTSSDRQA
jgi:hypothetical protein